MQVECMGVLLPLHLRDALREVERHVVHLRVGLACSAAGLAEASLQRRSG